MPNRLITGIQNELHTELAPVPCNDNALPTAMGAVELLLLQSADVPCRLQNEARAHLQAKATLRMNKKCLKLEYSESISKEPGASEVRFAHTGQQAV